MTIIRTYRELRRYETFIERFRYLALGGQVGESTFGFDRYINQSFYTSKEWRDVRHHVIARDNGCDLGIEGFEIHDRVLIHHMNPIQMEDFLHGGQEIFDIDFLITTTHLTHNAIHFGDERLLRKPYVPRRPGDTKLW